MIRGPKIKMTLQRYTTSSDGGGSSTKGWQPIAVFNGVLAFIWADERERTEREALENRYQYWVQFRSDVTPTTKDEFTRAGVSQRYRVVYVDNILEQNRIWKIDLVQTR